MSDQCTRWPCFDAREAEDEPDEASVVEKAPAVTPPIFWPTRRIAAGTRSVKPLPQVCS